MKFFKTSNEQINQTIARALGRDDDSTEPFSQADYALAFRISSGTAAKRLNQNPEINEISRSRAEELGWIPNSREGAAIFGVGEERLSLSQIQVRFGIPMSTLRKWQNNNSISDKIKLVTSSGYVSNIVSEGPATSEWKFKANGERDSVPVQLIQMTISGFDEQGRILPNGRIDLEQAYNRTQIRNAYGGMKLFYKNLKDVFDQQVKHGAFLRNVKLLFIPNVAEARRINENADLPPIDSKPNVNVNTMFLDPEDAYTAFTLARTVKMVKVENGRVNFISYDEFIQKISTFTVNQDTLGSDPDNGENILLGYRLVTSTFLALVEKSVLGRANLSVLAKNTHSLVRKHPYWNLFDSPKPTGKNSCFFDAIKVWSKVNNNKAPSNLLEMSKKYSKGVLIEDIEDICKVLGIHLQLYSDPKGVSGECKIGEYGESVNSEYEECVKLYYTIEPEPHYSCLVGVKAKLIQCMTCSPNEREYFNTQVELKKHSLVHREGKRNYTKEFHISTVLNVFDTETVNTGIDVDPYSISWLWSDVFLIKNAQEGKYSKDPMGKWAEEIAERCIDENVRVVLVAFNGSGFDYYPAIKALSKYFNFGNLLLKNNKIYNAKAKSKANSKSYIEFWDPFLFFRGSLDSVAKSFEVDVEKGAFDHAQVQEMYEKDGKTFKWNKGEISKKIKKYNDLDVEVLYKVVMKMSDVMPNMFDYCTSSSYAFSQFSQECKYKENITKTLDKEKYEFIRRAIVGGRTQTIQKYTTYSQTPNDLLCMIDVVSLYPSQMVNRKFPIGKPFSVSGEVVDKMGVYECIINHQHGLNEKGELKPTIVPLREDTLNWNHRGRIQTVLSSVTIALLRKHFGHDCVDVMNGLVWEECVDDLFDDFINKWIQVKKEEDVKKEMGQKYNTSLRNLAKLLMNSIYGKMIQMVVDVGSEFVSNGWSLREAKEKLVGDYDLQHINSDLDIISGKLKNVNYENCKPQHLGVFILDYTKEKMYDELFSQTTVYYSDSDSALIKIGEMERLRKDGVIKISKELGDYDLEMTNIKTFHSIEPKSYCLVGTDGKIKMRMKGVSAKSGWSDGELVHQGLSEDAYKSIIKNRKNLKFYCSQFTHAKSGLTTVFVDRVKTIKG